MKEFFYFNLIKLNRILFRSLKSLSDDEVTTGSTGKSLKGLLGRPLPKTPEIFRRKNPKKKNKRRNRTLPNISLPTDISHLVHVEVDKETGILTVS